MKNMDPANKQEMLRLQSGMAKASSQGTYSTEAPSVVNATTRQQNVTEASRNIQNKSSGEEAISRFLKISHMLQELPVFEGLS